MNYFDALVKNLFDHNEDDPLAPDGIYAKVEVPYGNPAAGKTFFHLLLTEGQMNYRHKLDLDAPGQSDPFAKSIKKADKEWTKTVRKSDGEDVLSPLHVFGVSITDYETGEVITPDDKPNKIVEEKVWTYKEPSEAVLSAVSKAKTEVKS